MDKKRDLNSDAGSSVIEFALVLPILLLILFGIINFGVLLYNQSVITNAAREGARWAAIHSSAIYGTGCTNSYSASPVDACEVAYSYASNVLISFGGKQLTVSKVAADYNSGTPQSVTVAYSYTGIGWFFGGQAGKQYSATAVMLHE
jgi:Flp pilus assembly protein TadG